jgi:hypothetical protein
MIPTPDEMIAAAKASPHAVIEWEIAFHESGHVISEIASGSTPDAVWINDDPTDTSHAGRTTTRSFLSAQLWPCPPGADPDVEEPLHQSARCNVETLLAGDLAVQIARGYEVDAYDLCASLLDTCEEFSESTDEAKVVAVVERMRDTGWPEGDIERWIEERIMASERILRRHWASVAAVAEALVDHRLLDRDYLFDVYDRMHREG